MEVQLRTEEGELIFLTDFGAAWQQFYESKNIWKISWTAPNGKRMRICKIKNKLLSCSYVEDTMDTIIANINSRKSLL